MRTAIAARAGIGGRVDTCSFSRGMAFWIAVLLATVPASASDLVPLPRQPAGTSWPTHAWPEAPGGWGVDAVALDGAVEELFRPVGRGGVPDTRALLIVQYGSLVFERYAEGFGAKSRFQSWSMAKSFTQALVGLLVSQDRLSIDAPAPVPQWQGATDPRRDITLRQLLNMTSGVDNQDDSGGVGPDAFVAHLIFGEGATDTTAYSAAPALIHEPGTYWSYSTGTSSLVAGIVGREVGPDRAARSEFIRSALFEPLGMKSALYGFDAAGHFLGGSNFYAAARDYARFGLFILRDGIWEGGRLLSEGWVDFARTPAPVSNNGVHGAHFWTNGEPQEHQFKVLPGGPASAFCASGNAGQNIMMVPTHDLIVVRLGELQATTWPELNERIAAVVAAFPELAEGER